MRRLLCAPLHKEALHKERAPFQYKKTPRRFAGVAFF